MKKRRRKNKNNKILIIVVFVLLLFFGTAYSYMNQRLDIGGTATIGGSIPEVSQGLVCNNIEVSKTVSSYSRGEKKYYTNKITIKNVGPTPIYYWHAAFRVPNNADINVINAESTKGENGYLLLNGKDYNTYISAGSSITFTVVVGTKIEYEVKNIQIYNCTHKQGTGDEETGVDLKVDLISAGGWKNTSQYTVRITNNSNTNIATWNLKLKLPVNSNIKALWNGDYVLKDNILEVVNKNYNGTIAASANTEFGVQITNLNNDFNIEVVSAKGYK